MDTGQLKHEFHAKKKKLDLELTVSNVMTYLKVAGVVVARVRSTPQHGRRSHLGGSLVVVPRYLDAEVV